MTTMKRYKNLQPGGRSKVKVVKVRKEDIDDTQEYSMHHAHESHYWQIRLDEVDAFGPVTVRNSEGEVTKVIEVDALRRPWQEKVGNTWNNVIFPKRNSDKV